MNKDTMETWSERISPKFIDINLSINLVWKKKIYDALFSTEFIWDACISACGERQLQYFIM